MYAMNIMDMAILCTVAFCAARLRIIVNPPFNTGQAFENYDDNLEMSIWLQLMRDRIKLLYNLLL